MIDSPDGYVADDGPAVRTNKRQRRCAKACKFRRVVQTTDVIQVIDAKVSSSGYHLLSADVAKVGNRNVMGRSHVVTAFITKRVRLSKLDSSILY